MNRTTQLGASSIATLLLAVGATGEEYDVNWSASLEAMVKNIDVPEDDDDVTGFFDLYEYTSGKSRQFPVQLGLRDLDLDVLGTGETPLLQVRFESPTSNLSLSGSNETPFLNQRADLFLRHEGIAVDLDYRRMRSDELRLFPNPGAGFPATTFNDDTARGDRFYTQRTGVGGEMRLRTDQLLQSPSDPIAELIPQLSVRGKYEKRDGQRQFRYLNSGFSWRGATQQLDQRVGNAGAGLVLTPGGLFTLSLDVDHEQFRENAPQPASGVNFIPDTDRTVGTARLQRRFGQRAVLHGGFRGASLKQIGDFTSRQLSAGLRDNKIRYYSANAGGDLILTDVLSANAFFKYDLRDNRIQRDTALFNPISGNPSQVAPFLETLEEMEAGLELAYRPHPARLLALGYRGVWVDRDLDFANPTALVILPTNTVIHADTERHSLYLRGRARLLAGLNLSAEAGYREAPETGYIRELSQAAYFTFRGSYSVPISRPLDFSLFGRGEFGENDDFRQLSESPGVADPNRDFERNTYAYGLNASFVPTDPLTLFASFFQNRDAQMFDLVRSNVVRYFEPITTLNFVRDNPLDYRADLTNVLFGGTYQLTERTDTTIAYSYTHSTTRFDDNNATGSTLRSASRILSDIHSVDVRLGHWFADGLRAYAGYRWDDYQDDTTVPAGTGSVVAPFDLSTTQHTFTIGVTLTNALLGNR
ncbi:MAG: hypothetical protein OEY15_08065 [Myxococcales bacterium]|nr:hypothetical protein [Myxococcales bacterium]